MQIGSRSNQRCDIRIDCNPARLGIGGIDFLYQFVNGMMPFGADRFFSHVTVTRIDIAIDLWGSSAANLIVRDKGKRKHGVYSDQTGTPQTIYAGTPKSNRIAIYTKVHNDGRQSCRFERRVTRRTKLEDLIDLLDPFSRLQIISDSEIGHLLTSINTEHFFDSVRVRGLSHALKKLSRSQAKAIREVIADPANAVLPPTGEIWKQWPDLLQQTLQPLLKNTRSMIQSSSIDAPTEGNGQ